MMTTLFDDRERAAEYAYTHGEELRFLADRAGVEALGVWAAQKMGVDDADAYAATLVEARIGGADDTALLQKVTNDLGRAGVTGVREEAGQVLARATAEATLALHGTRVAPAVPTASDPATPAHHRNAFWGWES